MIKTDGIVNKLGADSYCFEQERFFVQLVCLSMQLAKASDVLTGTLQGGEYRSIAKQMDALRIERERHREAHGC